MAKRASKKSSSMVPILLAVGAVGAAAILLMPKKASAADKPASNPPNKPASNPPATGAATVKVINQGSNGSELGVILFTAPTVVDGLPVNKSDYLLYLEAFNPDGSPIYGPITSEPPVTVITPLPGKTTVSNTTDLLGIIADGGLGPYLSGANKAKILAAGGKVLVWLADSNGNLVQWWRTQWS